MIAQGGGRPRLRACLVDSVEEEESRSIRRGETAASDAGESKVGSEAHDRRTLAMLCVAAFASMASMRCADSILPALAQDFATTTAIAASAISAFALGYGVLQLVFGTLGDRFGKFRVIALATLACTVGAAAAALSPSLPWLRASRFISGATAAAIVPLTMAWIGDNVAYERRQEVLAQLLGATVSGMIAGQWLGGVIADAWGWRADFVLLAVLFGAIGVVLNLEQRQRPPISPTTTRSGAVATVVKIVRAPWPRVILAVTFVEGAFAFGALAFIPSHLQSRFGLSMGRAGAVLALYGIGGLLYSRAARVLIRRLGERRLAALGGSLLALSLGSLAFISEWPSALASCAMAGFGFYALHGTLQTQATQMAPATRGAAMSLFACFLFLGQSIGVLAAAWTFETLSATTLFAFVAVGILALTWTFAALLSGRDNARS
jgi:predicted MFS family arabinose efflux permease